MRWRPMLLVAVLLWAFPGVLVAEPVQSPIDGHWYEVVPDDLLWPEARDAAAARVWLGLSGHLATITSAEESDFVLANAFVPGSDPVWLGGYQDPQDSAPAENWHWITGEPWVYTDWGGAEPNDHSGEEYYLFWYYDIVPPYLPYWCDGLTGPFHYIVEYEASTPVFWEANGHSYQFVADCLLWPAARNAANQMSWMGEPGHLATITSPEESDFVLANVFDPGLGAAWLGGYQDPQDSAPAENWHWITGEPWVYTDWGGAEPNDHSGEEYYLFWYYDIVPPYLPYWCDGLTGPFYYIVEYGEPPDPVSQSSWGSIKSLFRHR